MYIVVTRDGSVASLYMNGQLEKSETYSFTLTQKGHNLIIGGIGTRGDWAGFFKGKIDDVRIYDIALTGEEISTLYEENL